MLVGLPILVYGNQGTNKLRRRLDPIKLQEAIRCEIIVLSNTWCVYLETIEVEVAVLSVCWLVDDVLKSQFSCVLKACGRGSSLETI